MVNLPLRLSALHEYLRGSLWVLPTLSVAMAILFGALLSSIRVDPDSTLGGLLFAGGADGAHAVLQVVAGSVITVTGLTFSLTILTLQIAASQYSPRLLRNFLRDRGNQVVLSTFLATFAFTIVVLRTVRADAGDGQPFVPQPAVTVGVVLALASIAALVYFIHHLTQSIRVETILTQLEGDTLAVLDRVCMHPDDGRERPALSEPPPHAAPLAAHGSGLVQALDLGHLLELAHERDVVLRYRVTVGEHVTAGTVLAWAWRPGATREPEQVDRLEQAVNAAIQLGKERTLQQDVAFGIRQLVDVAIKALSPSLNDPTTAIDAVGRLSVVLCALATRRLGPHIDAGPDGSPRVEIPYPTFEDYLHLACDQISRYGSDEPLVGRALQRLLEDVAAVATSPARRNAAVELERRLAASAGHGFVL